MTFRPIVITVTDSSVSPFRRHREPVRIGIASPRGAVASNVGWKLTDQSGNAVPLQTTILDRWGDATVRWLLVDFQADVSAGGHSLYTLEPNDDVPLHQRKLAVTRTESSIRISTGPVVFELPSSGQGFIASARSGDRAIVRSTAIMAEAADGTGHAFTVAQATINEDGPLRASVRLDGSLADQQRRSWLDCQVQLHFYAGLATVDAELSVTNSRAARHPGGRWDLGDPGSALIRELSIELVTGAIDREIFASLEEGDPITPSGLRFSVYQDSSGGVNWQHINHVNRDGRVPATFRGFRAERGARRSEGLRATPIVAIGDDADQISAVIPRFWQMCPKALTAGTQRCVLSMFPRQYSDLHELQPGERTTLQFSLCFGRDTVSEIPLAWVRSPLAIAANPESYETGGACAPLSVGSSAARADYHFLVGSITEGDRSFAARRELIDEYGWRNFGDLYADHEAVNTPVVSHYNNQYDAVAGFLQRFLVTADVRWWTLADALARHVIDIDLYHTSGDRAAYNGGYFWHTQHYAIAGTATHRTYSKLAGSHGGGPSNEHNYTTGLMTHYFLTGSERSKDAVIQLAEWVLNMDDGRKSRFRWIDRGDTGLASSTRFEDFHGPGRGAGNSINALLDAHRLSGDPRYLEKADALIARCVHPDDNQGSLKLLDAENRWSYTVFLQAIGKYLEYRADRGLLDQRYGYARDVLTNYASWMTTHERPYLERPEALEHPTETWVAQDIRKAAVFEFAACHARDETDREKFLRRATYFFDYAVQTLRGAQTGQLTRPLVLLLAYGFQRPMVRDDLGDGALPAARVSPSKFVPQRTRVVRRLLLTAAGLLAAVLLLIGLILPALTVSE